MYIGPPVAQYALLQNRVYAHVPDTVPEAFRELFVHLGRPCSEALNSIRQKSGFYWTKFEQAKKIADELEKERRAQIAKSEGE